MKQSDMKKLAYSTIQHEIKTASEVMNLDRAEGMLQLANSLGLLSEKQSDTLSEQLNTAFNERTF